MKWIQAINEADVELLSVQDIKKLITSLNIAYEALVTVSNHEAIDSTEFSATNHNKIALEFCGDVAKEAIVTGAFKLDEPGTRALEVG